MPAEGEVRKSKFGKFRSLDYPLHQVYWREGQFAGENLRRDHLLLLGRVHEARRAGTRRDHQEVSEGKPAFARVD